MTQTHSIIDGWWQEAEHLPSPNFSERPQEAKIELLVIHNISLPPGEFGGGYIQQFFLNRLPIEAHPWFRNIDGLKVSAHCLIDREGKTTQFVSFEHKAWHAGESRWGERDNCNTFSIGIELEGSDTIAYTEKQYQSLVRLSRELMSTYPLITEANIVGHEHIAPERKTDPGPAFDWGKYKAMLAAWQLRITTGTSE